MKKAELKKPGLYSKHRISSVSRIVVNDILAGMIAWTQVIELNKTSSSIEITNHQAIRFRVKRNALVEEELPTNM